jgi:hypothetical protein
MIFVHHDGGDDDDGDDDVDHLFHWDEEIFSYEMNDDGDDDQDLQHHLLMTLVYPWTK